MSLGSLSKTQFSHQELQILQEIISSYSPSTKMEYKKMTMEFNKMCEEQIQGFKTKSVKAIQLKIKQICRIVKHFWNFELDQIMLNHVASGLKWKQIASCPQFRVHNLSSNEIKRKFQCGIRYKFLCLYRQIYKTEDCPHISDVTFKCLLQEAKIVQQYENNCIDQGQKQCLIDNTKLFRTSIDEWQDKRQIRSSKTKIRVLGMVQPNSLRLLVASILKLHNHRKYKKSDVIEQLLNENSITRPFKQGPHSQFSPESISSNYLDQLQVKNQEPERKNQQIHYQLTFSELEDVFPLQANPRDQDINFMERAEEHQTQEF